MAKMGKADLLNYLLDRANTLQDRADKAAECGLTQLNSELRSTRYEVLDAWSAATGEDYAAAVVAAANLRRA